MSQLKATIGFATDKGTKDDNEDFVGAIIPNEPQLTHKGIVAAIADGMSGSDAGKHASQACIAGFLSDYFSTPDSWSVKHSAQKVLSATNSWLYSQGQIRYLSAKGMASTLSIIVLKSTTAHIFHVGDSRIYRMRKGNLEQLTRDHRIWTSSEKNYLSRAMGIEPRLEVDYKALPLELNDLFILTTDGVHDFLDDTTLKKLTAEGTDLTLVSERILLKAKANKSDDNLTCQLLKVHHIPEAKEDEILHRHANLPFPPLLHPGMVLDGYRIEAEIHASKRTQIYRAMDTHTNTQVILKTPSILYEDDTFFIEHFLHEEWAGKRINNKNVVKVLGTDRPKSCIYYVTEFIAGQTLRDWIGAYPKADIQETRKIVDQLTKGLRAFHRMEMLHQDLKPENIMIGANGLVKIIDFGSVKIAGIAEIVPQSLDSIENILGTLNYTAPEYHLGHKGTIKSDLYSLAVITYEMLNAALPFNREIPEKPSKRFLTNLKYTPSYHHNPMVPTWIDGALKKATSIIPQERYNNLTEFMNDLNHPNPNLMYSEERFPLIQRSPLQFWQGLCAILIVINVILLYLVASSK